MKKLLLILLLLPSWAGATIVTLTSGDLPYTASTNWDTLRLAGNITYSSMQAIKITGDNVRLEGNGDTLFYGTNGAGGVDGFGAITIEGAVDSFYMRDLTIMHDPGNNGAYTDPHDDPDTLSTASWCGPVYIGGGGALANRITFINCNFIHYGDNARSIDSYGNGTGSWGIIIDSCHFWNECQTYGSRHSYEGTAVRLELRPTYTVDMFAAHIYRSVIHRSAQVGFSVFGNTSNRAQGIEIAQCTVYVDSRNVGGENANQYGILTRTTAPPFNIHDNYIRSGTLYGGSRGIMVENALGTIDDSIFVQNNRLELWGGPDAENLAGIQRGIRVRSESSTWDYVVIRDNWVEVILDTDAATTHIGSVGWALNLSSYAINQGLGHALVEGNTFIIRNMSASNSGAFGAAFHMSWDGDVTGTCPVTTRYNKYVSADRPVWLADKFNEETAHDFTMSKDTLSFLPASDSGTNLDGRTAYFLGERIYDGQNNFAVNMYYDTTTGITDKDIELNGERTDDLSLVQRIPITVQGTNADSLVANYSILIEDAYGGTYSSSVTTGTYQPDLKYWKTYGSGTSSDSDYNPFIFTISNGADTTVDTQTIDWKNTCLTFDLAATTGSLDPADSCASIAPPNFCPTVTIVGPEDDTTLGGTTLNIVADIVDLDGDVILVQVYMEPSDVTPDFLVYTDTVTGSATNWTMDTAWSGLLEDSTYYWRINVNDDSCTNQSAVRSFTVDSIGVANTCPTVTLDLPTSNDTLAVDSTTVQADFLDTDGDTLIVQLYGGVVATPVTLVLTDTIIADSANWVSDYWGSLAEDDMHYWRLIVTDTGSCADTSVIDSFFVNAVADGTPGTPNIIEGTTIEGVTIGQVKTFDLPRGEYERPESRRAYAARHRYLCSDLFTDIL